MGRRPKPIMMAVALAVSLAFTAACGHLTPAPVSTAVEFTVAFSDTPTHQPTLPVPSAGPSPTYQADQPAGGPALSPTPLSPARSPTSPPTPPPTNSPTSPPPPLPAGSPAALPTAPPADLPTAHRSDQLSVWEQDITLLTYDWATALVPVTPDDPIYPYPRLNFDAVAPPGPHPYRAVVMQNAYIQLLVVPELGGRILRWTDRTTNRQLLYNNPVIKPTHWGYRGWWLAIGGIEWAFPTEEHGLNEYRPWKYQLLRNGVRVWDTDDRSGLIVEIMITLDAEHSYFTLTPRITNPGDSPQAYQFWANAMLVLSDVNIPSPELVFILPDDAVTVHSTGDSSLPGPGGQMNWPLHNGRDFSRYREWRQYLGIFANPAQADFVGAYDLGSDQGVVRIFPHTLATGVKLFCLGDLPSTLWTDDNSRYFELWGGLTPTFWSYHTLEPGATVSWTEWWYPVSGTGGYGWANREAAIRLLPTGDRAEIAVAATRALNATIVLLRDGIEVQRWEAIITPGAPFLATGGPAAGSDWSVQIFEEGVLIAQFSP